MKRLILAAGFLMALALPASVSAAAPKWNLTGGYQVTFVCTAGCFDTYVHSMTIATSSDTTGAVVGTGHVEGAAYVGYDWTVTGTVSGSDVTLDIEWAARFGMEQYNPLMLTGSIDSLGHLSGAAIDGQQRTFTWSTTEGAAVAITPTPEPTIAPTTAPTTAPTATATAFTVVEGQTATTDRTPPPTSTGSGSSGDTSTPVFALLVCLAFGGLGLVATEAQRRSIRS